MKSIKIVSATLIIGAVLLTSFGCQQQEGPAERAGKQLDKAAEKTGQQIEEAGQRIQDAAKGDRK